MDAKRTIEERAGEISGAYICCSSRIIVHVQYSAL